MDFLISLYPMVFRTERWPTRVIFHLVSMSLVKTWIEYKEREAAQGNRKKNIIDLLSFREHVVEGLCRAETSRKRPVGQLSFQNLLNSKSISRDLCKTGIPRVGSFCIKSMPSGSSLTVVESRHTQPSNRCIPTELETSAAAASFSSFFNDRLNSIKVQSRGGGYNSNN